MKKHLFFPLQFLILACSSEEMEGELQGHDPLVGSWDVIRLDTNEYRDRVIYRDSSMIMCLHLILNRD